MKYLMVITTTPDKKTARKISKILIEKSLAGCCQITGPIESHYVWKNRAEISKEYLCFIKTSKEKYKNIEKAIKDNHPYEVPEIIAFNITKGLKSYFDWLNEHIKP
jgi:periplasmic divalent cation tolerance protein